MSRLVFPPAAPADVISQLYPRLAGGTIRNMRILQSEPLVSLGGAAAAFIRYQYILVPQSDLLFEAQVNPVLLRQGQVQMEGAALIMTFPPLFNALQAQAFPDLSVANQWSFVSRTIEAPSPVFQRNRAVDSRIWQSYRVQPAEHLPTIIDYEPQFEHVVFVNPDSKEAIQVRRGRGGRKGVAGIGTETFLGFLALKTFEILKRLYVRQALKDGAATEQQFRAMFAEAEMECAPFVEQAYYIARELTGGENGGA